MSQRKLTRAKRPGLAAPLTKRSTPRMKPAERQKPEKPVPPLMPSPASGTFPSFPERTRVVLLPVNPYLIHAYWELTAGEREEIHALLVQADLGARVVLRFYDVTGIVFDGQNARGWFDVDIDLRTGNWYVHLWSPEKSYMVDLGIVTGDGRFYSRARSNVAETPRVAPSVKAEERYLLVRGDYRQVRTVPPLDKHRAALSEVSAESLAAIRQQVADVKLELTPPRPAAPGQILADAGTGAPVSGAVGPMDITAMNERSLVFGVSSGEMASPKMSADGSARPKSNEG